MAIRAADILVRALQQHGVERIFAVPGESYLSVLDALVETPQIQVVTTRHEGGAGFMALADARLSGRAGVAFVSRGPGAMNAAIAVHTAQQDALPLVLFVGQVERPHLDMQAFQEVDYTQCSGRCRNGPYRSAMLRVWPMSLRLPSTAPQAAFPAP